MDEQIKQLLSGNNDLLSLPQTLAEVLRVTRTEGSSASDLAEVLLHDPAMTAKVLRIVNSPFYGVSREIGSMQQAVMTIGFRQVTALALSSSIYNMTGEWQGSIDMVRFWRHSLECAIASRMLAETVKYPHAEEAFVAGLLHEIGSLVLEKSYPDQYVQIQKKAQASESIVDLEDESWNTNHARVGQFLLEQWNVPDAICTAVGHHHDLFADETTNPDLTLSQIVTLADLVSQFTIWPEPRIEPRMETENREIIRSNLNLTKEQIQGIQKELFSTTVREAKFLEIEIGSIESLLEEANQMLFAQYLSVETLLGENRDLRQQLVRNQVHEVAQQSLGNFASELNRHINNATATMKNQAIMVQEAINESQMRDMDDRLPGAMQAIMSGMDTLGHVMKDLTNLACLDSSMYTDDSSVLDLEERIKERLEALDVVETVAGVER